MRRSIIGMAPNPSSTLPVPKVVLGLLMRRPNETATVIAQLTAERFSYADFLRVSVYLCRRCLMGSVW